RRDGGRRRGEFCDTGQKRVHDLVGQCRVSLPDSRPGQHITNFVQNAVGHKQLKTPVLEQPEAGCRAPGWAGGGLEVSHAIEYDQRASGVAHVRAARACLSRHASSRASLRSRVSSSSPAPLAAKPSRTGARISSNVPGRATWPFAACSAKRRRYVSSDNPTELAFSRSFLSVSAGRSIVTADIEFPSQSNLPSAYLVRRCRVTPPHPKPPPSHPYSPPP